MAAKVVQITRKRSDPIVSPLNEMAVLLVGYELPLVHLKRYNDELLIVFPAPSAEYISTNLAPALSFGSAISVRIRLGAGAASATFYMLEI